MHILHFFAVNTKEQLAILFRCPCSIHSLHPNCLPDCSVNAGKDPRCPCSEHSLHPNCPPDCSINAGKDPRCPCSEHSLHPNCPPDCEQNIGTDRRCPCSRDPLNPKCPPDCKRFQVHFLYHNQSAIVITVMLNFSIIQY